MKDIQRSSRLALLGLLVALAGVYCSAWAAPPAKPPEPKPAARVYDPTDQYAVREIEGWQVRVNEKLVRTNPKLCDETLTLMRFQLYQIPRKVPAAAVAKIRKITIWVEEAEGHHPCMAYHPDAGWLRDHQMNPDKAGCVEVANARNFLKWTRPQPWMVLHELAHGYHDRFLPGGYANAEIRDAYERMKASKRYASVLHLFGKHERAYAMQNPMEYFAETSEAFFGTNDFYPFVAAELKEHDPEMVKLLEKSWGSR